MQFLKVWKLVAVTALVGTALAQQRESTDEAGQNLKVDVQLVQLPVAVIDRDGRSVRNLSKQNFDIFEDGVQNSVASL
jgi:hypothetical protein